jgi:hypothetical protein
MHTEDHIERNRLKSTAGCVVVEPLFIGYQPTSWR